MQEHGAAAPLTFGVYPGGPAAEEERWTTEGPANDPARIDEALSLLQPAGQPLVVRCYIPYLGQGRMTYAPADPLRYIRDGRQLDLVLCYRVPDRDLADWTRFIRQTVRAYGPHLTMLQITEEPNSTGPGGDGKTPGVRAAIVPGILAAKEEIARLGHKIQVGFSATVSSGPGDDFWTDLKAASTPDFLAALDYVALDFFPDVYRPLPPDDQPGNLAQAVPWVLRQFREMNLAAAGIPPSVPMHIGENGWPTTPTRSYERQAAVLETVVRTVHEHRASLNITHYEHFCLRDAETVNPALGYQFGLLSDDYTAKPAFTVYRALIRELGVRVEGSDVVDAMSNE